MGTSKTSINRKTEIMQTINKKTLLILLSFIVTLSTFAQLDKSVLIIKEYIPSISDAYKLNIMPQLKDTASYKPDFKYRIYPTLIKSDFELEPIKPARLVNEKLKKLFGNYVKLGFGSDISPLAEIKIHNVRSRMKTWGAEFKHHSSYGKFSIDDREYYPNFSNDRFELYGSKFLMFKSISANISFDSDKIKYYGFNPVFGDPEKDDLIDNRYSVIKASARYKSERVSKLKIAYDTGFDYYFFFDKDDTKEHGLGITADFRDWYKKNQIGFDTRLDLFNRSTLTDTTTNLVLKINPWVQTNGEEWNATLGVNTYAVIDPDANSETYFYPNISFSFALADRFLLTYWGFTGKLESNFNKSVTTINPFVIADFEIRPTSHKKIIYGGVKGNISSKLSFDVKTTYSELADKMLFINDYSDHDAMKFAVVYEDMDIVNVFSEVAYDSKKKFSFRLKANYYTYFNLREQDEAWNMPDFDITLRTAYNLMDKILVHADFFVIGKRPSLIPSIYYDEMTYEKIELDEVYDFNLGIEYKYNDKFSGFLNVNNLIASKYYKWNYYPTQRFHVMVGVVYAF